MRPRARLLYGADGRFDRLTAPLSVDRCVYNKHISVVLARKQDDNTKPPVTVEATALDAYTEACKYLSSVLVEPLGTTLLRPTEAAEGDELEIAKILVLLMHEVRLAKEALPFPSSEAVPFALQWEMAHMLSVLVSPEQWPDDDDSWSYILFESSAEFRRQNEPQPDAESTEEARTPTAASNLSTPKLQRRTQPVDGSFTAPLPHQRSNNNGRRRVSQDMVNSGGGSPLVDSFNSPTVMNARALRTKERELKKMKEELAEMRYCREEAENTIKELQQKLAQVKYKSDEKVADLRHRIDRDSRAVDRLLVVEPECERLSNENSALMVKVAELTRQRDEAREKADEANHELQWREQSIRTRLSSAHESKKMHDDLRAEIATLRQQLATAHQETKVEADRTRQKEAELDAVRVEHVELLRAVRAEYSSKIELAEDNWALEQRKSADLESRLAEMRNKCDSYAATVAELKQKLALLQISDAQLRTELERVQAQRDELESQRQVLESDMAAEVCKSTELEGRLTEMRSNRDALSRSTVDLKQKIISLKNDKAQLAVEVDRLRVEQVDANSKVQLLEADLATEQRKSADLEQRVEEMRSNRESLSHSTTDLKQQLIAHLKNNAQLTMDLKQLESEKDDLSDQLRQMELEAEDAQTRLAAMRDTYSVAVERASELERKVASLEKDKRELTTSKARTETELATLTDEHEALLQQVVELDARVSDLESDAAALTSDNDRLYSELESSEQQTRQQLQQTHALDDELQLLKVTLTDEQTRSQALNKAMDELQTKYQNKVKAVEQLQVSVQQLSESIERNVQNDDIRAQQLEQLRLEQNETRVQLAALTQKHEELVEQMIEKDAVIDDLTKTLGDKDVLVKQLAEKDVIITDLAKTLEYKEALVQQLADKDIVITDLTKTLADKETLVRQLADKDVVITDLTKTLEDKEALVKQLADKEVVIGDLTKQLDEKSAVLADKEVVIGDLTKQLDEKSAVVSDFTKQLEEKDSVLNELQTKLAAVDNENAFEQRSAAVFKSPKHLFANNKSSASIISPANSTIRADTSAFDPAVRQRLSFASIDSRRMTRGSFLHPSNAPRFCDEGDNEGDLLESTTVEQDGMIVVVVPAQVPSTPLPLFEANFENDDVSSITRRSSISGPVAKNHRRRSKSLDNQEVNAARLTELNSRNMRYQPHMRSMYAPETMTFGEVDLPETDFRDKENFVPPDPVKHKAPEHHPKPPSSASAGRFLSVPSPTPKSLKQRTKQFFGKMTMGKEKRGQSPAVPHVLRNEKQARGGSKFDVEFYSPKTVKKTSSYKKAANDSINSRSPLLPTNISASTAAASLRIAVYTLFCYAIRAQTPASNQSRILSDDKESDILPVEYVPLARCSCDLIEGVCDFGCCCDQTCSNDTISTYFQCPKAMMRSILASCHEPAVVRRPPFDLFLCRLHSSTPYLGHFYKNSAILRTQVAYSERAAATAAPNRQLSGDPNRGYHTGINDTLEMLSGSAYSYGVAVGVSTGSDRGLLRLPSATLDHSCSSLSPVRFLVEKQSSCVRPLTNTSCQADGNFNATSYLINSQGTDAITQCSFVKQEFSVNWSHAYDLAENVTDHGLGSKAYPRSGNPGYDIGRPLISAKAADLNGIGVDADENQAFTWTPDSSGLCEFAGRHRVNFGQNVTSDCFVQLLKGTFLDCDRLRSNITAAMESLFPMAFISKFGSIPSNSSDLENFVQVLRLPQSQNDSVYDLLNSALPDEDASEASLNSTIITINNTQRFACTNIPTSVTLDIFYTESGVVNQISVLEVVGALLFFNHSTWRFATKNPSQRFQVSSNVRFYKKPPKKEPPIKSYYLKRGRFHCPGPTCWDDLFFAFKRDNVGTDFSYALTVGLSAVIGLVVIYVITNPWGVQHRKHDIIFSNVLYKE
uniref:Tectonic domain-containing protein n=1 Tax=Plectus sambesii TaxID=2011161 RepID=A0A914VVP9_9BILA